jgi:hypothetical protein
MSDHGRRYGKLAASAHRKKQLKKDEETAEAKGREAIKEERALGKSAVKSQTRPRRNRGD